MNEFRDDEAEEDGKNQWDEVPAVARVPTPVQVAASPRVQLHPVLAGCDELQQLALARLLGAHEVKCAPPVATPAAARESNHWVEPPPDTLPTADYLQTDHQEPWTSNAPDDGFDLWDELTRPSNRKSLRSMV